MRERKIAPLFAAILALAALFSFAASLSAATQGAPTTEEGRAALLKFVLERKFNPQSMDVRLEGGPDAKGFVKKAVVRAKGAVIDKLRVDTLVMPPTCSSTLRRSGAGTSR